jgi:purine-binding chemotaxis protein CheW
MTTRTSKQHTNGTALLEESILDTRHSNRERAPDIQPNRRPTTRRIERSTNAPRSSRDTQQGTQQFVTFMAGDEVFAADMVPVKEIIRVPEVVRVPLAPAALEGLANLRGKVLPIISLRRLFGFPELAHDDSTRALVVDVGQPLGFVVDRVSSVVGRGCQPHRRRGLDQTTVNTEMLSSLIKDVGGHAMIMVLDFAKLIEREFSQIAAISKNTGVAGAAQASVQSEEEDSSDELQLVSFDVDGQEYAIAIEDVQEIVQVPEAVIHVPRSESHVLGVMTLRSRLLPLVNLRSMFALPHRDLDEKSRIVVLTLNGVSVGVVVDAVSEVLRVSKSGVDALPACWPARETSPRSLNLPAGQWKAPGVDRDRAQSLRPFRRQGGTERRERKRAGRATGSQEAGRQSGRRRTSGHFPPGQGGVRRADRQRAGDCARAGTTGPGSQGASFVEGVINLRGTVLPVIDLRLRLGLKQVERTDRQRIMVFLISDVRTGFIVDQVAEVLRIPKAAIEPAPQLSAEQAGC